MGYVLGTEDFRLFFSKNLKLFFRRLWKKHFRYFEKKSRKSGDFGKKVLDFLRKKAENLRFRAHTIVHLRNPQKTMDYSMCSEPKIFGGSGDFGKKVLDFLRKKAGDFSTFFLIVFWGFRRWTIVCARNRRLWKKRFRFFEKKSRKSSEPKIFDFFSQKI